MRASFIRRVWENPGQTICSVYLKPDKPYYFTPGQYADILIPHAQPDTRGLSRTMTFSSIPSEPLLCFTTRLGTNNTSTYKQSLRDLQPGDKVDLTDSMGDMILPLDSSIPLVFVAGGLGIASFVSMVKWLIEQPDSRDITLLYAVRDIRGIIFQDELRAYGSIGNLTKVLYTTDSKAAETDWHGIIKPARLTSAEIMQYVGANSQTYISGTERMVEQLHHELEDDFHIPQYRLVFDYFEGYTEL